MAMNARPLFVSAVFCESTVRMSSLMGSPLGTETGRPYRSSSGLMTSSGVKRVAPGDDSPRDPREHRDPRSLAGVGRLAPLDREEGVVEEPAVRAGEHPGPRGTPQH